MTTERKVILVLAIVIAAGVGFAGMQAVKAHDAALVATTQQQADAALKAEKAKGIADRDAMQASYEQRIAAQQAAVKTSAQAVQVIDHYVTTPEAAQPVVVQKEQLTQAEQAKLPDAPSYVVTTQQQSIDTAKKLLQCDADGSALSVCRSDLADTKTQYSIVSKEAATWEDAAKGGSKWTRIWNAAKYGAVGVAIGVGVGVGYAAHR